MYTFIRIPNDPSYQVWLKSNEAYVAVEFVKSYIRSYNQGQTSDQGHGHIIPP